MRLSTGKALTTSILLIAYFFSAFHLYTGFFGTIETYLQRLVHIAFALLLIFLLKPYRTGNKFANIMINGTVLAAVIASVGFVFFNYEYILTGRYPQVTPLTDTELILGIIFIGLVLEATRKMAGPALPIVTLIFLIYGLVGPYLPGFLTHGGYSLANIVDINYFGTDGAFGIPLGASASYIALFIIFGAFLSRSGLGDLLMDIAMGLAGHKKGGPAKVAIIGSALHGIMSGSAVANVLTVGTATIPMMIRMGYRPQFAAGVEAAASAGSQIMPPVMGIIALIMVQYTGIPYIRIAGYALLPALLYFFGIWMVVHYESVKLGLEGLPRDQLPDWKAGLRKRGQLLLPIFVLIALLVMGFSPAYAVSYSILSVIVVSLFKAETRMTIADFFDALQSGAKGILMIATATAAAGIISGMFGLTGIGIRFTVMLNDLAGGSLFLSLVFTAIAAFILGMGLPPSASYIIQVVVTIPAIFNILGMSESSVIAENALLLSHMFVMYFASFAVITPPDALAAFAGASIAKSRPMITALVATRLAFVAYFIPFLFVLNPGYLMIGSWFQIGFAVCNGLLGITALSIAMQGYMHARIRRLLRVYFLLSGLLVLLPGQHTSYAGIVMILPLLIYYSVVVKKQAPV
ncbi:MAG: TRAP transporter fused permease subunit [Gammaproteobacteria bacterium]|nr:TRAP transporter fused permease subunit [Gammaproteobacteria bacterium]